MQITAVAWSVIVLAVSTIGCYEPPEIEECRGQLQELLGHNPSSAEVGTHIGAAPYRIAGPGDAKELAGMWTNPLNSPVEVESKMTRWPETRIYLKSPMVYFIYVDDSGVMRDFSCLGN